MSAVRLTQLVSAWAVALWVGGLWAVGYLVAPLLFHALPDDRLLAGLLAGKMFAAMGMVGMVCGGWLLVNRLQVAGGQAFKQAVFWMVLLMWLLTLAQYFGIQPLLAEIKAEAALQAASKDVMESLFRDRFATWHGVSSVVYLIESLLGLVLIAKSRQL
ncbi:MAG: DUF4149 domain-containing protein [Betaproteobacteria bacterium]|nr:MAG: DUF4149 domain-containing protein [Betaproteobacteria bacterium]